MMKKSGTWPATAIASARSAQMGIPLGTSSRQAPESSPLGTVDHREDLVLLGVPHEAVGVLLLGVPKNASE